MKVLTTLLLSWVFSAIPASADILQFQSQGSVFTTQKGLFDSSVPPLTLVPASFSLTFDDTVSVTSQSTFDGTVYRANLSSTASETVSFGDYVFNPSYVQFEIFEDSSASTAYFDGEDFLNDNILGPYDIDLQIRLPTLSDANPLLDLANILPTATGESASLDADNFDLPPKNQAFYNYFGPVSFADLSVPEPPASMLFLAVLISTVAYKQLRSRVYSSSREKG